MKFTTLAVGAGSCHILETDDGQVWLFDCGSGEGNGPAQYLRGKEKGQVDYLFLLNEDDDHLSGLAELIRCGLQPRAIVRNKTINRTEWVQSKGGKNALSENAKAWQNLVESYREEGPYSLKASSPPPRYFPRLRAWASLKRPLFLPLPRPRFRFPTPSGVGLIEAHPRSRTARCGTLFPTPSGVGLIEATRIS